MDKELEKLFEEKTSHWRDSEVITVNGIKCCYTVVKNQGYLVHLPGGVKKFAHEMVFSGYEVILPDKLRSA
jgi:hypothetical protein